MKALVFEGPWEMPLRERADPQPSSGEVVVSVRAAGICGSDVHGYIGSTGRRRPGVVMGHEASGIVAVVGEGVASVRPGDRVALRSVLSCGTCDSCLAGRPNICARRRGLGMHLDGAYAECVTVPEALVAPLPDALSFEQGAMIEPLAVAMHAVNITPVELMDRVAIVGAGTIGLLTLLAVGLRGAGRTVITDRSTHRLEMARALGADAAIDVDAGDPVVAVREALGGRGADAVFEAVGSSPTVQQSLSVVRAGGHVTWIGNLEPRVELGMQDLVTKEVTLRGAYAYGTDGEFDRAAEALAAGRVDVRPLIEKVAGLAEGTSLFREIADGRLAAVKIILAPGS
ncbi:MAG TPA: galactitol-1-phosphate 5-dehydrogenase [Candidatus Limnocylindrales bacterium]|nr:galactitol-1-phosphate 5-dehydrogenase [Candidatus Limnocylindrales bacterium]